MAFVALLDANVLWSAPIRDTIFRATTAGLFRAVWTTRILDEMGRSLQEKRPDLTSTQIEHLLDTITSNFPEALVEGYDDLIPAMRNHPGDRHVLAAAVRAAASVIVTCNSIHFDAAAREPYEIDLQTPDEFLCHLWYLAPELMAQILHNQATALRNPPHTVDELIGILSRSVPQFGKTARVSLGCSSCQID